MILSPRKTPKPPNLGSMVSVSADESLDESVSRLSEELETEASLFADTPDDLAEVMSE
jgi:hypothetical protein